MLAGLRQLYGRLHLKVNEAKTAVASAFGRKFLGYALDPERLGDPIEITFVVGPGIETHLGIDPKFAILDHRNDFS